MPALLRDVIIGVVAYGVTMMDNLLAFSAQLAVTSRDRFANAALAQTSAVVVIVAASVAVGASLAHVPLQVVGVLAIAPWTLAWHQWRHRRDEVVTSKRRGFVTTFIVTLAMGGDNLAVWTPLLRASGAVRAGLLLLTFTVCQGLFLLVAQILAGHPLVVNWGQRYGRLTTPWLYVGLGFVILYECHLW